MSRAPAAPTPDPSTALALLDAGYWVVPLTGHRKHPPLIRGRTHGEILASGDFVALKAEVIATHQTATGWALVPWTSDPTPLAILDLDSYGLDLAAAWASVGGPEDLLPPDAGAVRSCSGGWHFYFRAPDHATAAALPGAFNWGAGRKGEVRASRGACSLLVLPGSVCKSKAGPLGAYELVQAIFPPEALAPLPDSLLTRLLGRGAKHAAEFQPIPTASAHLLDLCRRLPSIPVGERNTLIARVGQIAGVIGPGDKIPAEFVSQAWEIFAPLIENGTPLFHEVERALTSGYRTGRKNRRDHAPRDEEPTVDDVRAECQAIFGAVPWLIEAVDAEGRFLEYILGHGGEPGARANASGILRVKDNLTADTLATFARLIPAADRNAIVRSPLFTSAGWARVLIFMLMEGREVERTGEDPASRFWRLLEDWACGAASDGYFLPTWNNAWAAFGSRAWLVSQAKQPTALVLHPDAIQHLYARVGSVVEVKRLIREYLQLKALTGVRRPSKVGFIAVARLSEETQAVVSRGYEKWLRKALNKEKEQEQE